MSAADDITLRVVGATLIDCQQQRDDLMTIIDAMDGIDSVLFLTALHRLGHVVMGEEINDPRWLRARITEHVTNLRARFPAHDVSQDIARRLEDILARRMLELAR